MWSAGSAVKRDQIRCFGNHHRCHPDPRLYTYIYINNNNNYDWFKLLGRFGQLLVKCLSVNFLANLAMAVVAA